MPSKLISIVFQPFHGFESILTILEIFFQRLYLGIFRIEQTLLFSLCILQLSFERLGLVIHFSEPLFKFVFLGIHPFHFLFSGTNFGFQDFAFFTLTLQCFFVLSTHSFQLFLNLSQFDFSGFFFFDHSFVIALDISELVPKLFIFHSALQRLICTDIILLVELNDFHFAFGSFITHCFEHFVDWIFSFLAILPLILNISDNVFLLFDYFNIFFVDCP